MDPIRFIEHKGRRILFLNFSLATPGEHAEGLRQAARAIADTPDDRMLVLLDVTGSLENEGTDAIVQAFVRATRHRVRAWAAVGLRGLRRATYARLRAEAPSSESARAFEDVEEARDWLALH